MKKSVSKPAPQPSGSFSHLSLAERISIEAGLENNLSMAAIGRSIGKSTSTVSREIHSHIQSVPAKTRSFNDGHEKFIYDCRFISECGTSRTGCRIFNCPKIAPLSCQRRDKKGFCNGCPERKKGSGCKLAKLVYSARDADMEYRRTLSDCREGVNLTEEEIALYQEIISNGVRNGQSVYHILANHPEIRCCEKTVYNYIDGRLFEKEGVINIDLPSKVKRKMTKKKKVAAKKRKSCKVYVGRTYEDFLAYMASHPDASVVELDTVYNLLAGPFIQTLQFRAPHKLLIARLHDAKTSQNMVKGLSDIKELIGEKEFRKHFAVILTDRGTEFIDAEGIEALGCRVFYCDPMQSIQKARVENKHLLLRRVSEKKKDLYEQGLRTQEDLDLLISQIASYSLQSLNGKCSYDYFSFLHGEEMLKKLNIKKIDPDCVRLKPDLFKN